MSKKKSQKQVATENQQPQSIMKNVKVTALQIDREVVEVAHEIAQAAEAIARSNQEAAATLGILARRFATAQFETMLSLDRVNGAEIKDCMFTNTATGEP